jgi:hypothetical protein
MLSPDSYLNKNVEITLRDETYLEGIFVSFKFKKTGYYAVLSVTDGIAEPMDASRPFKFEEILTIKVIK